MKGIIVKEKTSLEILLISVVICIAAVNPAQAVPITFSFAGVGSGNLDTTVFSNAAFEVLIPADTDDVQPFPWPDPDRPDPTSPCILNLSGTIDISGVGIGTFVKPLYVFDSQKSGAVGFGNWTQYDLINLDVVGVGLDTYDLTTPLGPITDLDPYFGQFRNVELSIGYLTFTSMFYATFTAIPEPTTVLLLGLGGLGLLRKRRASIVTRRS
jgi:hypothetical protein